MCMLENFLCFELQTAGVIIGWLVTVKSLFALIATTFIYSYIPGYINGTIVVINNITNQTDTDAGYIGTSTSIVQGLTIAFIALTAIDFVASVLLLYGSMHGKRLLLLPWLIENGFGLMYSILTAVIITIAIASNSEKFGTGHVIFTLITVLVPVLFSAYVWSAVYSLYNWLAIVDTQRTRLLGNQGKSAYTVYQTYERV